MTGSRAYVASIANRRQRSEAVSGKRAIAAVSAAIAVVIVPLAGAETSYSDPVGDSAGLDIGAVAVSDAAGAITFDVAVRLVPGSVVGVAIDNDRDPETGPNGFAWAVGVRMLDDGSTEPFALAAAVGVEVPLRVTGSVTGDHAAFSVPDEDVAVRGAFDFVVLAGRLGMDDADDLAPDTGTWTYGTPAPAPAAKPVIGKGVGAPPRPIAGKRFTVAFPVTGTDGQPVARATVAATTRIAGKVTPNRHSYAAGRAKVTLVLPRQAKAKRLRVTVTVTTAGRSATRTLTYVVR
jgi:hypothetical protein